MHTAQYRQHAIELMKFNPIELKLSSIPHVQVHSVSFNRFSVTVSLSWIIDGYYFCHAHCDTFIRLNEKKCVLTSKCISNSTSGGGVDRCRRRRLLICFTFICSLRSGSVSFCANSHAHFLWRAFFSFLSLFFWVKSLKNPLWAIVLSKEWSQMNAHRMRYSLSR